MDEGTRAFRLRRSAELRLPSRSAELTALKMRNVHLSNQSRQCVGRMCKSKLAYWFRHRSSRFSQDGDMEKRQGAFHRCR